MAIEPSSPSPWAKPIDQLVTYEEPNPLLRQFHKELVEAYNDVINRDFDRVGPGERNAYQIAAIFGDIIGQRLKSVGLGGNKAALDRVKVYFSAALEAASMRETQD